MDKDIKYFRQLMSNYIHDNMDDVVRNKVQAYLNEELDEQVGKSIDTYNRNFKYQSLVDFLEEHSSVVIFIIGCFACVVVLFGIMLAVKIGFDLDIAHKQAEAQICLNTGYGCKSDVNNSNKYINYDNTPIVDVDINKGGKNDY